MDLVSWSLNAIDQIFLTGRQGKGEPSCPDGTAFAGYTMDSWMKWKIVCLSKMSVEDVEDLYMIGFMMTGFLLFGVGGYLMHQQNKKTSATALAIEKRLGAYEGVWRATNTQTEITNRKLDGIREPDRRQAASSYGGE